MNVEQTLLDDIVATVDVGMPAYTGSVYTGRMTAYSIADLPAIGVECGGFKTTYIPGGRTPALQERTFNIEVTIFGVFDGDVFRRLRAVAVDLERVLLRPTTSLRIKTWRLREAGVDVAASAVADEGNIAGYTLFYEVVVVTSEGDPTISHVQGP